MRSSTDIDIRLLRELVNYQPDLIIAYEGRNEIMNLPLYTGINAKLIWLHIFLLKNSPLYRTLNYSYDDNFDGGIKLWRFAHLTSCINLRKLKTHYTNNLKIMSDICRDNACPIVFLSQLKDKDELKSNSEIITLNSCLKVFASKNNRLVFDIDKAYSSSELYENDFVMNYTDHPGFLGYLFIAKEICKSLYKNGFIEPQSEWHWDKIVSETALFKRTGFNSRILDDIYVKCIAPTMKNSDTTVLKMSVHEFRTRYE